MFLFSNICRFFDFFENLTVFFQFFRARQKGYRIHCGRWLVEGNPQVILFDVGSASFKLDDYKRELFDKAGVGIPFEDVETNDCTLFG